MHAPADLPPSWLEAMRLASEPAPATRWRARLAEALCRAVGGLFASVVTCPPGNWLVIDHDTWPARFDALITRIDNEFVPRIDRAGEGWRFALEHFGKVYAPLEVAHTRWLAQRLHREVLAPEGVDGYLVAFCLDGDGLILGFFVVAARVSSDELLRRHRGHLEALADRAGRTLETALSLARACGLVLPAATKALAPLTQREREVARLVADGLSDLNVAARLDVSEATVGVHLRRVFAKLGIHSRQELVQHVGRSGAR